MYAFVPIRLVVQRKSGKNSKFNPRSITVLLYGANDLDGASCLLSLVICFDDFAKCSLTKELDHGI